MLLGLGGIYCFRYTETQGRFSFTLQGLLSRCRRWESLVIVERVNKKISLLVLPCTQSYQSLGTFVK